MEKVTTEDRKRFEELFQKLDVNKDGKIEANELASALGGLEGGRNVEKRTKVWIVIRQYLNI